MERSIHNIWKMSVFKVFKDSGAGCAPILYFYAIEFDFIQL